MSEESSGGVSCKTSLTALIISRNSFEIALTISLVLISIVRGKPSTKSLPFTAITNSSAILSKVYVPAEVFAFATAIAGLANFLISLVPLLVAQLVTGTGVPWTVLLAPIPILATLALVTGLGMLIAALAVFFFDVLDLTRVLVQLLYYLTPVFWTLQFIPAGFRSLVQANPLYSVLEVFRDLTYRGVISPGWQWAVMVGSALAALGLGVWAFSRSWKTLVAKL